MLKGEGDHEDTKNHQAHEENTVLYRPFFFVIFVGLRAFVVSF